LGYGQVSLRWILAAVSMFVLVLSFSLNHFTLSQDELANSKNRLPFTFPIRRAYFTFTLFSSTDPFQLKPNPIEKYIHRSKRENERLCWHVFLVFDLP